MFRLVVPAVAVIAALPSAYLVVSRVYSDAAEYPGAGGPWIAAKRGWGV